MEQPGRQTGRHQRQSSSTLSWWEERAACMAQSNPPVWKFHEQLQECITDFHTYLSCVLFIWCLNLADNSWHRMGLTWTMNKSWLIQTLWNINRGVSSRVSIRICRAVFISFAVYMWFCYSNKMNSHNFLWPAPNPALSVSFLVNRNDFTSTWGSVW